MSDADMLLARMSKDGSMLVCLRHLVCDKGRTMRMFAM